MRIRSERPSFDYGYSREKVFFNMSANDWKTAYAQAARDKYINYMARSLVLKIAILGDVRDAMPKLVKIAARFEKIAYDNASTLLDYLARVSMLIRRCEASPWGDEGTSYGEKIKGRSIPTVKQDARDGYRQLRKDKLWVVKFEYLKKRGNEEEGNNEPTCFICLECFKEGDQIREPRCDHVFHKRCIHKWIDEGNCTCPICECDL